jgi:hypothetical protein
MREILHIFKKDVRRHWPEILVSFVLLGLFLKVTLLGPDRRQIGTSSPWLWLTAESIPPLMSAFWAFLAVRVVQGETLVGDRQWWVTKPYEWWKLLAAKELFLVVFIALPLFFVQLYLLHHSGFPVVSNLPGVLLKMQYELGVVFFVGGVALGCLTRNLWQAVLTVVFTVIGIAGVTSLLEKIPNYSMSYAVGGPSEVIGLLGSASLVGAVGWQYARRKTWASRALILSGLLLHYIAAALTPYRTLVERQYPLVEPSAAPAYFTPGTVHPPTKKHKNQSPSFRDVFLGIPLSVSRIAPGHMVRIDGVRAYAEPTGGPRWDPGWQTQRTELWPDYQQTYIAFTVKRKDFESIKAQPLRLQLELAFTDVQEADARDLILKDSEFPEERLGICHLDERNPSTINCLRPFEAPGLMATFDPATANCEVPKDEKQLFQDRISHAWFAPHNNSSSWPNPVDNYQIYFGSGEWAWPSYETTPRIAKRVFLCPGAKVRLARPEEKKHFRVKLEMDGVRLEDLPGNQFDPN